MLDCNANVAVASVCERGALLTWFNSSVFVLLFSPLRRKKSKSPVNKRFYVIVACLSLTLSPLVTRRFPRGEMNTNTGRQFGVQSAEKVTEIDQEQTD